MDEEATDELAGCERHHFVALAAFEAIVLPLEGDTGCRARSNADLRWRRGGCSARDSTTPRGLRMGVCYRPPIRCCAVAPDSRRKLAHRSARHDCRKTAARRLHGRRRASPGTTGGTGAIARARKARSSAGIKPSSFVKREPAARNDDVHMRMVGERQAPGMENGSDADAGAEVLRVGCNRGHGLGRGLEQEIVDRRLILIGNVGDLSRQGEHHVEVRHR